MGEEEESKTMLCFVELARWQHW